ncbi:MAG: dihydrolipoyl dehydrogenase [Candidatus Caenarcaniphilales bacterium]|nr:dihydrolipoyl dehydrogenase [Candidatus Caenarcaniphilales bacterium]
MEFSQILPDDENNRLLKTRTHPSDWINPKPVGKYNLVVIGAGTAGLVTAAGAAGLGAKVALIEKHLMGGDCLNYGCIPSKTLIRSSKIVNELKNAKEFGIKVDGEIDIDFASVMERVRRIRAQISHVDSAQRFKDLGVDVFLGSAFFQSSNSVEVNSEILHFNKAVVATGARSAKPSIEGLEEVGYLTNETVFSLTEKPQKLAVIGAGPIGCELAQAFSRLGSEVTLIHKNQHILDKEDFEAAEIIQKVFFEEGIKLITGAQILGVRKNLGKKAITYRIENSESKEESFDEILVAAGRRPNVDNLGLENVEVDFDDRKGIKVNDYLQTSNSSIYAAGDICMDWKFTHAADAAARIVIQNALFMGKKKLSDLTIPWCTYTDPEIAHVGITENQARNKGVSIQTVSLSLDHLDRAITDSQSKGLIKVHLAKGSDRILGATIVAANAGDMISEITLAMVHKIGLSSISSVIHPYPTQAEIIKKSADAYRKTLLTPMVKKLFQWWLNITR